MTTIIKTPELKTFSKPELIIKCKELGIKGYSRKTKDDIIELITDVYKAEIAKNPFKTDDYENELVEELKELSLKKEKPKKAPKASTKSYLTPLVKWSGGKADEIKMFQEFIPDKYDTYLEPFIGGGAVFFKMAPAKAVISDVHTELIDFYTSIKNGHSKDIYEFMENHPNEEMEYYNVREMAINNPLDNAKRFYYLRKTCFRGMLRYNKKGQFNIPFGRYSTINYEDLLNKNYEELLGRTEFLKTSYETIFKNYIDENNFMFLDPPYDSEFTDYGYCQFDRKEHEKLAKLFKETKIRCLMIIGKTDFIEKLYEEYIVGEYDKSYKFKLYDGRIGDDINTKHLVIKNW
jgi:DNA adenine methylase